MKLLLLLLASFCAHSSWSVSSTGTPAVTQTPDVSVVEGETVNITCCWTLEYERIRVCWLKNLIEMNAQIFFSKNAIQGSLLKETFNCSHLTLTNVTSEDSGRYICNVAVDIPALLRVEGNGTVVTVTARDIIEENTEGGSHGGEVLVYVLRCLPLLALIITFFLIRSLGTKAQQHRPAAPGNEENQEEEERDEREIEAE
ncbi:uncharacterized protein LOC129093447 isoform X3 [Anoplopoma fimbria]|uniref:uncharacterized protein LOC129093447 isoform X3 n=1 Tax=Anoplopoma fimbria TaxID=229290 RepID=UPI0023EDED23|nr:uncharacterized protein LOC129093447 isoform X3 [Anoplopoma fimbria]